MPFPNPPQAALAGLLRTARTIAVIGLSDNPRRPSYEVASALLGFGYRIIPVNPRLSAWQGIPAAPDLDHAVQALKADERIDIVDVFRRPEHVASIVEDCMRLKVPAIWLQLGVVDEQGARRASAAGITVVMDRCIKIERMRIG